MSYEKQEIINNVREMIAQLKNKTYKSPFGQAFAEVFIEDANGENEEERTESEINHETITDSPPDPKRQLFLQMRQLVRDACTAAPSGRTLRDEVFYQQARFMENYEDDYPGHAEFSLYYPTYQEMSYEQLRTYFTWRSQVRSGTVYQTDLSYVFVYLYELINKIGVTDGEDGIRKLMFLWNEYRRYGNKLDKYLSVWVKDFYVLNECGFSFDELLRREPVLQGFYPKKSEKYSLDFYSEISAYKIKQSVFYTSGNKKLLEDCFAHVVKRITALLAQSNARFEDLLFFQTPASSWFPFSAAVYCPKSGSRPQGERTVQIADQVEYRYRDGNWTVTRGGMLTENGKQLVGYLLKRMEQLLRKATKFKYKLSVDVRHIDLSQIDKILPQIGSAGFLKEVDLAIKEFYINSKKTVVTVDRGNLETIRKNALITQEKLIVPETDGPSAPAQIAAPPPPAAPSAPAMPAQPREQWESFVSSLSSVEVLALRKILTGTSVKILQDFAKESDLMLEVLADGINQKALDFVGDNILELSDEIVVYDEYQESLRKAVESE